MSFQQAISNYLNVTKGIYPLVTFRILFGLLMAFGGIRAWSNGWIEKLYLEPDFFFKFYGFHWIPDPTETQIYVVFSLIIISALCIAFGLFYRIAIFIFFCCFTYKELIDATNYLNHYYLVIVLAFLLIFLPAHRNFSLDVRWRGIAPITKIPAYYIDVIIAQLTIVYTCAGLAKLNTDWMVYGLPLRIWLPEHADLPLLGYFFKQDWCGYVFSWGGAIYDLTIAYFLMFRKTRPFAYAMVIVFHFLTYLLFNIGLFPLIMVFNTLIFFPSETHYKFFYSRFQKEIVSTQNYVGSKILIPFFAIFLLVQIILPFRHHLYSGNLYWTEEGYRFGWRVMLVEKSGTATFSITDPETGNQAEIINSKYLTPYQEKQMAIQPDFILQFAHFLAEEYRLYHGIDDPIVTVNAHVALNSRASQQFIDPTIDLSKEKDSFVQKKWILPFR